MAFVQSPNVVDLQLALEERVDLQRAMEERVDLQQLQDTK
jgi:hypothetical protein